MFNKGRGIRRYWVAVGVSPMAKIEKYNIRAMIVIMGVVVAVRRNLVKIKIGIWAIKAVLHIVILAKISCKKI